MSVWFWSKLQRTKQGFRLVKVGLLEQDQNKNNFVELSKISVKFVSFLLKLYFSHISLLNSVLVCSIVTWTLSLLEIRVPNSRIGQSVGTIKEQVFLLAWRNYCQVCTLYESFKYNLNKTLIHILYTLCDQKNVLGS